MATRSYIARNVDYKSIEAESLGFVSFKRANAAAVSHTGRRAQRAFKFNQFASLHMVYNMYAYFKRRLDSRQTGYFGMHTVLDRNFLRMGIGGGEKEL